MSVLKIKKNGKWSPVGVGGRGERGATGSTGATGKSAYEYAKEGGYTGTESEFSVKLAKEYLDANAIAPVDVTSTDGVAYTATVSSIKATSLTELKGVKLVIIPNMTSTSASHVTLNVNGLGAKYIKRWDNLDTGEYWSFPNANWFKAGYPVTVTFNGTYWMIEGMNKPYASDLNGAVPVEKGGTGATTKEAARTNLGIKTRMLKFTLENGDEVTMEVCVI